MKWPFICLIYLYRWIPARFKRRCLFKETCSSFVLRVTKETGFWAGCQAMRQRFAHCRPGYSVHYHYATRDWQVEFVDRTRAGSKDIADFVLAPYRLVWEQAIKRQAQLTTHSILERLNQTLDHETPDAANQQPA